MKKVPLRKCTGCGEMKPKRELIRVVKSPERRGENGELISGGEVMLDLTGKASGRGVYICKSAACAKKARKSKSFERALGVSIPEEVYDRIEAELDGKEQEDA